MKGYKGFNKGMICRGKQYAENTVFEEPEAREKHGWITVQGADTVVTNGDNN